MEIIRWMRVILSSIFILLGLGFGTYFYIKEHPITSIDPQGCIVRLSPAAVTYWQAQNKPVSNADGTWLSQDLPFNKRVKFAVQRLEDVKIVG